jgi:hypothetical protein
MQAPLALLTEEDVRGTLRNALRFAAVVTLIATPILWLWQGWQTWLLFVVGVVISATGIFEWLRLFSAIMARMEEGRVPSPMFPVLAMFFLRLALAGLLLYASLSSLHGSVYALLAGLAVSLLGMLEESVRLMARK